MDPNIKYEAHTEEHKLCSMCQSLVQECPLYQGRVIIMELSDGQIERYPENSPTDAPIYKCSLLPTKKYPHYPTYDGLARSSEQGCHLCVLMYNSIQQLSEAPPAKEGDGLRLMVSFVYGVPPVGTRCEFIFNIMRGENVEYSSSITASFESRISNRDEAGVGILPKAIDVEHPAQLSLSTKSEACFQLVRDWMAECATKHPTCNIIGLDTPVIPTRVLDVEQERPRIVHTSTAAFNRQAKYLTLSYCWGQSLTFKLLTENIEQLTTIGIPLDSLPRTLRDAVIITRRLGYKYIWIDALCIIQDSVEDWVHESATMGDIYRHSALTIAALHGKDTQSGCFVDRNPLSYRPCRIREKTKYLDEIYIHAVGSMSALIREWQKAGPSMGLPLQRRAWVFSERVVSPRSLYYGAHTISWECIEKDATESRPTGDSSWGFHDQTTHWRLKQTLNKELLQLFQPEFDPQAFFKAWCRVVDIYTSCLLTYGRDKLPAIFGIIKIIENKTDRKNIVGLWKCNILCELLWRVIPESVRPTEYRAPSWSWASVDGNSTFFLVPGSVYAPPDAEKIYIAELLEVEAINQKENGEVDRGSYVSLRCPVRKVKWEVLVGHKRLLWNLDYKHEQDLSSLFVYCILLLRQKKPGFRVTDGPMEPPGEDFGLILMKNCDSNFERIASWSESYVHEINYHNKRFFSEEKFEFQDIVIY